MTHEGSEFASAAWKWPYVPMIRGAADPLPILLTEVTLPETAAQRVIMDPMETVASGSFAVAKL